jgi:hypothetical protein
MCKCIAGIQPLGGYPPPPPPPPLPLISFKLAWIVRSNELIFDPISLSFASGQIFLKNACGTSYSSEFSDLHWVKYWQTCQFWITRSIVCGIFVLPNKMQNLW